MPTAINGINNITSTTPTTADPIGNSALGEFPPKIRERVRSQFDEQPSPVAARRLLAENDLTFTAIDLADPSGTVALVPTLLEPERTDVETQRAVHVSHEEDWPRVPAMNRLAAAVVCHSASGAARTKVSESGQTLGRSAESRNVTRMGTSDVRRAVESRNSNGQGGIRTHGTLAGTPVFETGRFNRSRTCPLTAGEQNTVTDAQTHRRTDTQRRTGESYQVGPPVDCSLFTTAASVRLFLFSVT